LKLKALHITKPLELFILWHIVTYHKPKTVILWSHNAYSVQDSDLQGLPRSMLLDSRVIDEVLTLPRCYPASTGGSPLTSFRDILSAPYLSAFWMLDTWIWGRKTLRNVCNNQSTLCNIPEHRRPHLYRT
jgi:hypothetical protein